jgi:hypothetical protein|tara:strand:+ start:618 stop:1871 length:1254 start_codon:yes stop_codon:yes gene_type:complete
MNDYQKLVGTGTEGDFVKQQQGVASEHGFNNVSKDWYPKTMSYDEGFEQLESDRGNKQDYLVSAKELEFEIRDVEDTVQCGVVIEDQFFVPTNHALTQMTSKLCEGKGTGFVRGLRDNVYSAKDEIKIQRDRQDAEVVEHILSNGKRRIDGDTNYKIRTYNDGTMRAFVSEKYAEVSNSWFLRQLKNIIPAGRLSHWRGDTDTIWGNVLIPDTIREEDDSDYGGMVSVSNCEIGKRNVKSMPSLFRAICMNGCIWSQTKGDEIKVRHIGDIDFEQLSLKLRANIERQIPLIPQGIQRLLGIRAMGTDGVPMKKMIAAVATMPKSGVDKRGATAILEAWVTKESKIAPAERSLFDVVNSVTRAGQYLDNQSWVKFDELGGRLTNSTGKQWEALKRRAEDLEDDDLSKIFSGKPVLQVN